ncbi:MAG: carboxypeptidase-like regulatory domain-containing protein [Candidatus Solibacter sp.]
MRTALCLLTVWATSAQQPVGLVNGTLLFEPKDPRIDEVNVKFTGEYGKSEKTANPNFATTLKVGPWNITATIFDFCADPNPTKKTAASSTSDNQWTIRMRKCPVAAVKPKSAYLPGPVNSRVFLARYGPVPQPEATVSGVVKLADGRPLEGIHVSWLGVKTAGGDNVELRSGDAAAGGAYRVVSPTGPEFQSYLLSVQKPGYQTSIFSVPAGGAELEPIVLNPVDNVAADPVIEMEPMLRYVFVGDLLYALPLAGFRSFDEYSLLMPGVFPAAQTFARRGPSLSPTVGTAGELSINGARGRDNNYILDGSDANDEQLGIRRLGFISPAPQSLGTVSELQVITSISDARYGRSIGGQVTALSRSAAREFHADAYGLASDARSNARNYFDVASPVPAPAAVQVDGHALGGFSPSHSKEPDTKLIAGAVAGGAIEFRNEPMFLVGAFERQSLNATRQVHFATPAASERQVDPSQSVSLGLSPGQRFAPAGEAIFSLLPFPNNPGGPYGANTYTAELPDRGSSNLYSVKIDRNLTAGNALSLRYSRAAESSTLPATGGALFSSIQPGLWNQNVALFLTSTLTPNLTHSFRGSYGTTRTVIGAAPSGSMLPSAAVPGAAFLLNAPLLRDTGGNGPRRYTSDGDTEPITGFLGQLAIPGFSPAGVDVFRFPQTRANGTWQAADVLTVVRKRHVWSAGFDARFLDLDSSAQRNARPTIVFGGLRTPDVVRTTRITPQAYTPLSLAAAGVPSGIFQTLAYGVPPMKEAETLAFGRNPNFPLRLRSKQLDFFLQDEWRPRNWLSITAGVRLAIAQLPTEADDRILRAFDRAALLQLAGDTAGTNLCALRRCGDLPAIFSSEFPQNFRDTFGADSRRLDLRTGFALKLPHQAILRGGFGRYSGQFPAIIITESQSSFPDFLPVNLAGYNPEYLTNLGNDSYNKSRQPQFPVTSYGILQPHTLNLVDRYINGQNSALNPLNLLVLKLENAGLDLVQPAAGIRSPYSFQQALLLERSFGARLTVSAGYVGSLGRHLLRVSTTEQGFLRAALLPVGAPDPQSLLPFPLDQPLQVAAQGTPGAPFSLARELYEGTANSAYHSLQLQTRWRQGGKLSFGTAFTWAHAIDDASDFFDSAGSFALPQNSLHRSERGSSSFDARLRATGYFLWEHAIRRRPFEAWQFSGVLAAQTGQPFTVSTPIDVNRDGNLTDRLNSTIDSRGADRRQALSYTGDPVALLPAPGTDGALGRNSFTARPWYNADLALSLRFRLSEKAKLTLRAESFNAFNRANFGIPVRILGAPGFGYAPETLTLPRSIQFGAHFGF